MFANRHHKCAGRWLLGAAVAWFVLAPPAARAEPPASGDEAQKAPANGSGTVGLPGIFFSPDSGLAGYLGVLRYFRVHDNERPSQLAGAITATADRDVALELNPDLWLDGDRTYVTAELLLAWRNDLFFGIGNDTPSSARESYRQIVGAAEIRAVRRLPRSIYVGGVYEFRYVDIREVEPDGLLASGTFDGSDGGLLSGVGLVARWDTRDTTFSPRSGALFEVSPRWYSSQIGSDHTFLRLRNDFRYYVPVFRRQVVAFHVQNDLREGDPPFDHMAFAGGQRLLRGMLRGRFRDMVFVGGQVELRTPVWGRFGAVAFAATGAVAPSLGDLELGSLHYGGGVGIRFAVKPKERLNLRLDVAISDVDTGLYLNILEAF